VIDLRRLTMPVAIAIVMATAACAPPEPAKSGTAGIESC